MDDSSSWAQRAFGGAVLGDVRRTARLVRMASQAARRPAGTVSAVFGRGAERQAAYDLLESDSTKPAELTAALSRSTAHACSNHDRVLVVLDGASITITDRPMSKRGLGRLGTYDLKVRGMKMINAIALTTTGEPLGVADQQWWTRERRVVRGTYRSNDTRESVHWRDAVSQIDQAATKLAPDTKLHFLADREADASLFIWKLMELGHEFTIRSNSNRTVLGRRGAARIRPMLAQRKPIA